MSEYLKSRLLLYLLLIIFVACKVPHLSDAYYWDESWPYAVAIKDLYKHGISLMPDAIDAEISRGHPLFFHCIAVGWMHVFGASHVAMHSFALTISVLFLIAVYEVGLRLFNSRVALVGFLLVVSQVIFFVQSSFVLFEMLVAFLAFLGLYCYVTEKYLLAVLCLSALFYTKESGLVLGVVLGLDAFFSLFAKSLNVRTKMLRVASVAIPSVLIAIYFIVQKQVRGWYIFPLYHDLTQHVWKPYWYTFRVCVLDFVFYENWRNWLFVPLMMLSLLAAWKNKNFRLGTVFLTGLIICLFVDDMRPGRIMPSIPFFLVFLGSVFYMLYCFSLREFYVHTYQRRFIRLLGIFVLCFLCFCPLNFFTPRYSLAALVPLMLLVAIFFDHLICLTNAKLHFVLIATIILVAVCSFVTDKDYGDCNRGAYDGLYIQQSVVDYFEQNVRRDEQIGIGSFLESQHLKDPATGFLHGDKGYSNVNWDINAQTRYAVLDNIEPDNRYVDVKKDTSFRLDRRFEKGRVWAEIYRRK